MPFDDWCDWALENKRAARRAAAQALPRGAEGEERYLQPRTDPQLCYRGEKEIQVEASWFLRSEAPGRMPLAGGAPFFTHVTTPTGLTVTTAIVPSAPVGAGAVRGERRYAGSARRAGQGEAKGEAKGEAIKEPGAATPGEATTTNVVLGGSRQLALVGRAGVPLASKAERARLVNELQAAAAKYVAEQQGRGDAPRGRGRYLKYRDEKAEDVDPAALERHRRGLLKLK